MPACPASSCTAGSEPTRLERKSAVEPPFSPRPESQTVILSIFRFWMAYTCSATISGSFSSIKRVGAMCG
jgi:hypothetical protein